MSSLQRPAEVPGPSRAPKSAAVLMLIIVAALVIVALFSNIQRFRRGQIETVIVMSASSATPQPR